MAGLPLTEEELREQEDKRFFDSLTKNTGSPNPFYHSWFKNPGQVDGAKDSNPGPGPFGGPLNKVNNLTVPPSNKGKQTMGLFDRRKQPSSVTGGKPYFTSNMAWNPTNTMQENIDLQKQADWKTKVDELYNWKDISKLQTNPEITLGDQMLGVDGMAYDPWKMAQDNASFGFGKFGPDGGTDPTKKDTDWLGWAGIGTGLLQGVGGIMDYFSNMRGLELTEEAMKQKYAADDRNYLAQATALNNVIDTRKDFINKTQGGRNTDFLKNIPV